MLAVQKIEKQILSLSHKEYTNLRSWFYSQDNKLWDKQIEEDSSNGKLDFLILEAKVEKQSGKLRHL
jgi:hypothetical protein